MPFVRCTAYQQTSNISATRSTPRNASCSYPPRTGGRVKLFLRRARILRAEVRAAGESSVYADLELPDPLQARLHHGDQLLGPRAHSVKEIGQRRAYGLGG